MALTRITGTVIKDGAVHTENLPDSGVTAGSYGTGSAVPVLTVNSKGIVTALSTTAVAGVSNVTYNSTTGVLTIDTSDGSSYTTDLSIGSIGSADTLSLTGLSVTNTITGEVSSIGNHDTDDLSEGASNLYYTDARVSSYLTTNSYATSSDISTAISNLIDSAPGALDTLNELAAAIGDDANFATTVTNSLATKVDKINITGATVGSGTAIPVITYNAQGQITSATTTAVTIGTGVLTVNTGTGLSGSGTFNANATTNNTITLSLANTAVTAGTYGSASAVPVITIDAQGRITSASTTAVAGVSSLGYNTSTGVLTVSTSDGTNHTVDLGVGSSDTPSFNGSTFTAKPTVAYGDGSTVYGNHAVALEIKNTNSTLNNYSALVFRSSSGGSAADIEAKYTNHTTGYADLLFGVRGSGGWFTPLTVAQTNRVGINTTNPQGTLDVSGNIVVSGTVDGRDVAADGTKLDGIESGATADQTASEILTLLKTVDGSGSGLDADTVDGTQLSAITHSGDSVALTGDVTGSTTVASDGSISISTTVKKPISGDWWNNGFASIGADGVMEVGKYIDFHDSDTATSDYSARLWSSGSSLYNSGNLYANSNQRVFADNYHPNADKWTTARTLSLSGDASGSVSWDGSANATLSVTVNDDSHTHNTRYPQFQATFRSGAQNFDSLKTSGFHSLYNANASGHINAPFQYGAMISAGNTAVGGGMAMQLAHERTGAGTYIRGMNDTNDTWYPWQRIFMDNYHPNADKWTTARTLSLTGDVTGSVSWDGSGNASLSTTVADDSHNHTWTNIDGGSVNDWGGLRHSTPHGYIDFGPANTSHAHIYTDSPSFYFNKQLYVLGSRVWHAGNDGSGSGLDADLLDGQHGSYYTGYTDTAIANLVASAPATLDTLNELAAALGDDPNFATTVTNSIATKLNSSAYTAADVLTKIKTVDGSGSGLDADTVDGLHASTTRNSANTIPVRDANGYLNLGWINTTSGNTTTASSDYYVNTNDGYIRKKTLANVRSEIMGVSSGSSFLRSDANDTFSGALISSSRDAGIFGAYDSTKTDQIWSMGTTYRNSSTGANFGNLYGLAYKHTNNATGGTMAGGHQMVWCQAGTGYAAMGSNIWTSGNVTAYSDIRVKTNLEVIPNALEKVKQLNGYTFDRTDVKYDEDGEPLVPIRQTGVVAQEVLKVLPEAVTGDEENHYSVAYGNMVGLLIEAIKEQQIQIDELKSRLEDN